MVTLLYYSHAVDCTMLTSINTIVEEQANPTQNTESAITHFLDYAATNPSAIVQYKASDMLLHIGSDSSYLSEPWASSRTGEHCYLRLLPYDTEKAPNIPPPEMYQSTQDS